MFYKSSVGEQNPYRLSIHWRPQFELPDDGLIDVKDMEETVYYIDYQGVRVIALNSNRALEEQAEWLEQVLADNPNRWTVVTFHHPVFSSSEGRDNPELREHWKPLFDRYHVDLALQGHDHTYARGHDHNLTQGVNTRDPEAGTVYVNSVSGAKKYDLKENRWDDFEVTMDRAAENTQLYQVIRVDRDTLKYRAHTVTGELYDAFDLINRTNGPSQFIQRISPEETEWRPDNTVPHGMGN